MVARVRGLPVPNTFFCLLSVSLVMHLKTPNNQSELPHPSLLCKMKRCVGVCAWQKVMDHKELKPKPTGIISVFSTPDVKIWTCERAALLDRCEPQLKKCLHLLVSAAHKLCIREEMAEGKGCGAGGRADQRSCSWMCRNAADLAPRVFGKTVLPFSIITGVYIHRHMQINTEMRTFSNCLLSQMQISVCVYRVKHHSYLWL